MDKSIQIGIIGAGAVGERVIRALERQSRAKVAGVYDTNAVRLEEISQKYNIPTVEQYQDLLQNEQVDVIYLAVPPKYHHPIALEVIEAKKHFICEKPLANSISEAKEMFELAEQAGIVHAMNFPTIFTPAFKKMRSLLDEGFIGELRRIELHGYFAEWPRFWQQNNWIATREQGGFVREVFTHFIQMTQMVFGQITDIETKITYPQDPVASESGIIATGALQDGTPVLFNGFSNIGMQDQLAYTVYGTEGTISLENWRELWTSSQGEQRSLMELPEHDHLLELLDQVFRAMDGEEAKLATFADGYYAQIVIEHLLGQE